MEFSCHNPPSITLGSADIIIYRLYRIYFCRVTHVAWQGPWRGRASIIKHGTPLLPPGTLGPFSASFPGHWWQQFCFSFMVYSPDPPWLLHSRVVTPSQHAHGSHLSESFWTYSCSCIPCGHSLQTDYMWLKHSGPSQLRDFLIAGTQ